MSHGDEISTLKTVSDMKNRYFLIRYCVHIRLFFRNLKINVVISFLLKSWIYRKYSFRYLLLDLYNNLICN